LFFFFFANVLHAAVLRWPMRAGASLIRSARHPVFVQIRRWSDHQEFRTDKGSFRVDLVRAFLLYVCHS
jgi:hypothetical protein